MKKACSVGQMIADGWGNRRALEAEEAIKNIERQLSENDEKLTSGEIEFEDWEKAQEILRGQIPGLHRIIRAEKLRYDTLLAERKVA
jgi:hypothetical protein